MTDLVIPFSLCYYYQDHDQPGKGGLNTTQARVVVGLKSHILEWLADQSIDYQIDFKLVGKVVLHIKEPDRAVLFKLTWL